jgi:hypothetical protein
MWLNILRKILLIIGALSTLFLLVYGPFFALGHWIEQQAAFEETWRLTAPDGKVDAVLMAHDAGATTSVTYSLYIVPSRIKVTARDVKKDRWPAVFMASDIEDQNIHWIENYLLEIKYVKAHIYQFRNHLSLLVEDQGYGVEIKLREAVDN